MIAQLYNIITSKYTQNIKYNKEVALDVISYVTAFLSRNLLLCLHIDRKSLRLLREDNCGLYRIKYFSHKHSWQLLVMLL